ncbi:MAG: hypothetical protein JW904_11700 [Spirochaetales bacterium]|nr:hypothetical protein [Spirochaetales bacterium]
MNKTSCLFYQQRIQELMDTHQPIPKDFIEHITSCSDCSGYYAAVSVIGEELSGILEKQAAAMKPVDFNTINRKYIQKRKKNRIMFAVAGIAAAVIICAGSGAGYFFREKVLQEELIQNETNSFVDALFEEPFLDGVEYTLAKE